MENIRFKADVIYGHVVLKAWIEVQGDKLVGMGSRTDYDRDGKITRHTVEPTGLTANF